MSVRAPTSSFRRSHQGRSAALLALGMPLLAATAPMACGRAANAPPSAPSNASTESTSPLAPASVASSSPAVPTAVDAGESPSIATQVMHDARAKFDACYAMAKQARPSLGVTVVTVVYSLDDGGKPMTVDFTYRNAFDDKAKDCMKAAAEGLRFPANLHGKQTGTLEFPR